MASPVIPIILLSKIAQYVGRDGRYIGQFFRCLPALLGLVVAWALGEASGYLGLFESRVQKRAIHGI
jgi:hypothetical protein